MNIFTLNSSLNGPERCLRIKANSILTFSVLLAVRY